MDISTSSNQWMTNRGSQRIALATLCLALLGLCGCPKNGIHPGSEFNEGKKAEAIEDYDSALAHYNRALKAEPTNIEYKLKVDNMRFQAGQAHVEQGEKLENKGDLQMALNEYQKAMMIDPSSPIAQQDAKKTVDAINSKQAAAARGMAAPAPSPDDQPHMMSGPPALKPLSTAPINLRMTNDSRMVFDTVAKLAGLTAVFDPDFTSRRITADLSNVTIEQALDIVSLQAKAFWKPVTNDIIFIAPDQAQKRRDYEEEIVRTIYLKNTLQTQDLTEIVNGLRQLLDLRRVQAFNAQNAIVVRDTPDKVMLAEKIVEDVDKPKSEVVIQFAVLQADRQRARDLGINPGSAAAALSFNPGGSSSTSSTSTSTSSGLQLGTPISTNDYSLTLPSFTGTALLTDSTTQIIDDPSIRIVDGQEAKLSIGERVPVATGSFQAGVGVGATGTAGIVNPLVNTQFQYLDVGVIIDVTPRIHLDDVSLKLSIEVSSLDGTESIGGISQPIISTKKIQHDVRLADGEVNVLGGLMEHTQTKSLSGFPGLSDVPFLKYFTADNQNGFTDTEVLLVVIPHIIRRPGITAENLRSLASGTDTTPEIRLESEVLSPAASPAPAPQAAVVPATPSAAIVPPAGAAPASAVAPSAAPAAMQPGNAQLVFAPATFSLKPGETTTVAIVVQNAQDLYSMPLLLQYDPKVISVEDVRQGEFLSGGTQPIAVVQRVDKEHGQAIVSATRMPNTPGVSGSGTVFGVTVRGIAAGSSKLSIVQVNARDSQQRPLAMVTNEATVQVRP